MTARCELCGAIIRVDAGPMLLNPGTDPELAAAVAEISLFDLLAGKLADHLHKHGKQAAEMSAVMFLAGKVYAMTWAESPGEEPEFSRLRESWRTGIMQMMHSNTNPVAVYEAPDEGTGPGAPEPPEGSKEKKSVRNVSN